MLYLKMPIVKYPIPKDTKKMKKPKSSPSRASEQPGKPFILTLFGHTTCTLPTKLFV